MLTAPVITLAPGVAPAVGRVLQAVLDDWPQVVERTVEAIWDQVPAYRLSSDPQLRDDLRAHVDAVFRIIVVTMALGRPAVRSDFPSTREQAFRRVEQGVALNDFLQAFRIGQTQVWHAMRAGAGDDPEAREAALSLVDRLMQVIELGSSLAAEGYLAAQQHQLADLDRVLRDLVEDLLRGDEVLPGPKQARLSGAGLQEVGAVIVVSAVTLGASGDDRSLRAAVSALRRARVGGAEGLAAARQDEVIGILPVPAGGVSAVVERIEAAVGELGGQGVHLATGISTVHRSLSEVPAAYGEARVAREVLSRTPGVVALPLLTSFDYLVLREDDTARRLVRPELRRFVEDDLAKGGTMIATLREYVACELNAKTAAERLHMHVNTAYYRLSRISEATGCDLRTFSGALELLVAVRLLEGRR